MNMLVASLSAVLLVLSTTFAALYSRLTWERTAEGRSAMELALSMALLSIGTLTGINGFLAAGLMLGVVASAERLKALLAARRRYRDSKSQEDSNSVL